MYYLVQFADKSQKVYNGCSSFKGNDGNRRTEDVKVGCDLLAPYNGTLYQCEVISITEEKPKKVGASKTMEQIQKDSRVNQNCKEEKLGIVGGN